MSFFITIKIIIVLLLFQATLISRSVSQEINDAADPHPGKSLELSLELSEKEARLGDYLYARVTIKNIGDKPVDAPLDIHRSPTYVYCLNSKFVNVFCADSQRGFEIVNFNGFGSSRAIAYKPLEPGESRIIDLSQLPLYNPKDSTLWKKLAPNLKEQWALTTKDDEARIVHVAYLHYYNPDGSVRLKKKYTDIKWKVSHRSDERLEDISPDNLPFHLTASAKIKLFPAIQELTEERVLQNGQDRLNPYLREDRTWYDKLTPGPKKRYWSNYRLLRKALSAKDEEESRKYFREWDAFLAGLPEIERHFLVADREAPAYLPRSEQLEPYIIRLYRESISKNFCEEYWRSHTMEYDYTGNFVDYPEYMKEKYRIQRD